MSTFTHCPECAALGSGTITLGDEDFNVSLYRPTEKDPRHTIYYRTPDGKTRRERRKLHKDATERAEEIISSRALATDLERGDRSALSPLALLAHYMHPDEACEERVRQLAYFRGDESARDYRVTDCGCQPDLALKSRQLNEAKLLNWVVPVWATVSTCRALKAEHTQRVRQRLVRAERGRNTQKNVFLLLGAVVKYGKANGFIDPQKDLDANFSKEKGYRNRYKKQNGDDQLVDARDILDWDQIAQLSDAIRRYQHNANTRRKGAHKTWPEHAIDIFAEAPFIAAATGLRQSELLGLTIDDVEFKTVDGQERAKIHVWRQAVGMKKYKLPKASKVRTTYCMPEHVHRLRKVVELAKEHHSTTDVIMQEPDPDVQRDCSLRDTKLLFPKPTKTQHCFEQTNFYKTYITAADEYCGWKAYERPLLDADGKRQYNKDGSLLTRKKNEYVWHGLRHRFAVELLRERGVDPTYVSEWLGHEEVSLTMNRYGAHPERPEQTFYTSAPITQLRAA